MVSFITLKKALETRKSLLEDFLDCRCKQHARLNKYENCEMDFDYGLFLLGLTREVQNNKSLYIDESIMGNLDDIRSYELVDDFIKKAIEEIMQEQEIRWEAVYNNYNKINLI